MAFGLLDPIDVTFPHDFMMLVLSCHAYAFRIIRIALRLLLSSVAMFCIGPRAIVFFFLLAVTLIVYGICQVDGTNIDPVDSGNQ